MSIETPTRGQELEAELERAAEEAVATAQPPAPGLPADEPGDGPERDDVIEQPLRVLLTVGTTVLAAAMMMGGIFIGVWPRIYAAFAGAAGVYIAFRASRSRSPWTLYGWVAGGILLSGILAVGLTGIGDVPDLGRHLREAALQGDLLRPPVLFQPGWKAILAWAMTCIGFGGAWIALELRRPALGLLIPIPLVAFAAISVPKAQQLPTGLACLALLAAGLALLSSLHERGADDEAPGARYEMQRAMRAVPLVAGVTLLLYIASRSNFLFPPPIYDPTQEARKPKTIPLSEVTDRVLFEVKAPFTGPWKLGTLDVYDGTDWRLPPFNEQSLTEVPDDGVVDPANARDPSKLAAADFTVRGLTGAVLPGLANTVGIIATIPNDMQLSYDVRAATMRVTQGQLRSGFTYKLVAAGIPQVNELRDAPRVDPEEFELYLDVPEPPAAVQDLLRRAPSDNLWDRLDFLRQTLLKKVAAQGQGVPISIKAARVGEMLTTEPEATPFEIVAAQAMLARWAGVPSRIGYGFDKGDPGPEKDILLVRPKHGAVYLEVYFAGFGWLPIIGDPLQAKADFSDGPQQFNPNLTASEDITVALVIPTLDPPAGELFRAIRRIIGVVVPVALLVFIAYVLWPLPYKAVRRARRRTWAAQQGPAARIALAYSEWRDAVTDFGYPYMSDPPLMFLTRFTDDEEHAELAWLLTRSMWGDLRGGATLDDAVAAEELSAALRARLARAHPWTLRAVAALSRQSVRNPYAPTTRSLVGAPTNREVRHEPA